MKLCAVPSHTVNLPVGLFAFTEVRFHNDCSSAICLDGYQQTFIFFLAQPTKANAERKSPVNHTTSTVRDSLNLKPAIAKGFFTWSILELQEVPHKYQNRMLMQV